MTGAPHPKLDELIATLERLRAPGGCAWDREQTHESLVRYLIEETHELVDAIESGNRAELVEELGDVLYQVIFHADIAAHSDNPGERFDLEDVAAKMTAKMIGRHPHVFGDATAETAADVIAVWDDLKAVEKPARTSVLDGIPQGMPSLLLADKLLGRAERVARHPDGRPELAATDTAAPVGPQTEEELGATLLTLVASARTMGLDSERALRSALRVLQEEIRGAEAGAESAAC
ncbi:MAG: nucleoside triphosphate pyrophosphohydrolase [Microbacteriaceae bacterium]|nr:nucleoside triphosphate pyrophosphohydrolase [Microbacteriaceae bacterium]